MALPSGQAPKCQSIDRQSVGIRYWLRSKGSQFDNASNGRHRECSPRRPRKPAALRERWRPSAGSRVNPSARTWPQNKANSPQNDSGVRGLPLPSLSCKVHPIGAHHENHTRVMKLPVLPNAPGGAQTVGEPRASGTRIWRAPVLTTLANSAPGCLSRLSCPIGWGRRVRPAPGS